jgi:predicted transcriptional regulator
LMTRNPIATFEEADLTQAAKLIISNRKSSLPVTDHKSGLFGLLTKHDVVRALGSIANQAQSSARKACRPEP